VKAWARENGWGLNNEMKERQRNSGRRRGSGRSKNEEGGNRESHGVAKAGQGDVESRI